MAAREKLYKYKKAPKAGATLQQLNDYKAHIKEVDKKNAAILTDRKARAKAKADIAKMKSGSKKK